MIVVIVSSVSPRSFNIGTKSDQDVVVPPAAIEMEAGAHADVGRKQQLVDKPLGNQAGDVIGAPRVRNPLSEPDMVDLEKRAGFQQRHLELEVPPVPLVADDDALGDTPSPISRANCPRPSSP
jgi:hypothetical protein